MLRKFIFKAGGRQLTLPVTPSGFTVQTGQHIEMVNIHEMGDVTIAGNKSLGSVTINCEFPARDYYYADRAMAPYDYVAAFEQWIKDKKPVRFVVSGTPINRQMLIESISYGERDGTNDVYADIALRDWQQVKAASVVAAPVGQGRPAEEAEKVKTYKAVYGDTLCGICRKFYNDGSYALACKLASHNSRPNPNILYVDEVLEIPPRARLGG